MASKICNGCTFLVEGKCTKNYKGYTCPIRTKGGRYVKLDDSNIEINTPFGTYKFPSESTKVKFEKMLEHRLKQLSVIEGTIFKYTDRATKTFDLTPLVMLCYEKTYKESLIYGNNIYTKAKG